MLPKEGTVNSQQDHRQYLGQGSLEVLASLEILFEDPISSRDLA